MQLDLSSSIPLARPAHQHGLRCRRYNPQAPPKNGIERCSRGPLVLFPSGVNSIRRDAESTYAKNWPTPAVVIPLPLEIWTASFLASFVINSLPRAMELSTRRITHTLVVQLV